MRVQGPAITALAGLLAAFPDLPAADFEVSMVIAPSSIRYGVNVTVHDRLDDFEIWREALAIEPDEIEHTILTTCQRLKAHTEFAGAPLVLTGFAPQTVSVAV